VVFRNSHNMAGSNARSRIFEGLILFMPAGDATE
jgi:hypothetical protein